MISLRSMSGKANKIRISIVVCVYNRQEQITFCVKSLLEQTSDDFEVIVIDDASRDRTGQVLKKLEHPKLKILTNEANHGPAYSRNRSIKEAKGEYILFVDSDCVADRHWASQIIRPFEQDPSMMIVSGKTLDAPSTTYWEMVNEGINFIAYHHGYVTQAHTCNMAVRKSFLDQNPFDEALTLPFSEDLDLSIRCLKQQFKIFYTSSAKVTHFHRSTFTSTVISNFRCGIYNTLTKFKHHRFPYLNYGTYLLFFVVFFTLLGLNFMAGLSLVLYLGLIGMLALRVDDKSIIKLILGYPGRALAATADCVGNMVGIGVYLWRL